MTRPAPDDLDALAALHADEERQAAHRRAESVARRPQGLRLPPEGGLPESSEWLERLYAGDRIVQEKKPGVFDHMRSSGAFFASVDREPLVVLDGMSQTATIPGGFAPDPVVRAYMEGEFGDTPTRCSDTSIEATAHANAYADVLREKLPGLPHVTFTNSGAEAIEKAIALCLAHARGKKILAFEGSFHGRTLLALHATFNPRKRQPFEIPGYEATFIPFPVWSPPSVDQDPSLKLSLARELAEGDPEGWTTLVDPDDELAKLECEIWRKVDSAARTGDYALCLIEPMQAEGGDRYGTRRFFQGLRIVTRRHEVSLVFDEVQTGFGLGGPFAWHTHFDLIDGHGNADVPDAVVFAKRAQVGVVMSHFVDPEPTSAHEASLVRGRLHAGMFDPEAAARLEREIRSRLGVIASDFPGLVGTPRGRGYAFAFDLPTPELLQTYIKQRFYRGAIVFGAGSRTARYRLSSAYQSRPLDILFSSIEATLQWMSDNPQATAPAWENNPNRVTRRSMPGRRIRVADSQEAETLIPRLMALEERAYEPARREPIERLRICIEDPRGQVIVAEVPSGSSWEVVGFALAAPVERFAEVEGPKTDPRRGLDDTLYSVTITVDRPYRGLGIGRALKRAQVDAARTQFSYITGRNRVGATEAMMSVNVSFGAYEERRLTGQYGEAAEAIYYRIPLGPRVPPQIAHSQAPLIDAASGICAPFEDPPASLAAELATGGLYGPTVNKITLCNYTTPGIVRALEWISALTPHPHLYLTSCRDELVDKALRVLRTNRPGAAVAIGWKGGYFGHTTAAARSISDPEVHRQGKTYFDWPLLEHPAELGTPGALEAIRAACQEAGGADNVFGLVIEAVQERTGRRVPDDFWPALEGLREELGLPVVLIETSTASYRSGRGPFYVSGTRFVPDLLGWWGGGQIGFLHATSQVFVRTPLTMVSTWDGDELSLIRVHHQLRAARELDIATAGAGLRQALDAMQWSVSGAGLYQVIHAGPEAAQIQRRLEAIDVRVRRYAGGQIALAPSLDRAEELVSRLKSGLEID